MLTYMHEGDIVVVHSMERLAPNLDDLQQLVKTLTLKKVAVQFVKENLMFSGDDTPMANLMLSVMGAFAEFERSLSKERQREGVALAKARGTYKRRKKALSEEKVDALRKRAGMARKPKRKLREILVLAGKHSISICDQTMHRSSERQRGAESARETFDVEFERVTNPKSRTL